MSYAGYGVRARTDLTPHKRGEEPRRVGPLIDLARLPRVSAYLRQQALAAEAAALPLP
jgi:hypothetical protein